MLGLPDEVLITESPTYAFKVAWLLSFVSIGFFPDDDSEGVAFFILGLV
jgi:hypothetical protein